MENFYKYTHFHINRTTITDTNCNHNNFFKNM